MTDAPHRLGRRLGVYSLGFFKDKRIKRVLEAAGWDVYFGPITKNLDAIAVWGDRPVAKRGLRAALRRGLPVVYVEDAFIRSASDRSDAPLAGLTIDPVGHYVDCSRPSRLEELLSAPVVAPEQNTEAALDAFLNSGLSKFNEASLETQIPESDFVLVVDQVRGDASIRLGRADEVTFQVMLRAALDENPGVPIVIKLHPRAESDPSKAHFKSDELPDGVTILDRGQSAACILERASKVYCVTSQLGFEAILRGHRPRVFGGAFYAGWGLSEDEMAFPRRTTVHTNLSLFQKVMMEYPIWFDPYHQRRCDFMSMVRSVQAQRRSGLLKESKWVASGMRLWKRSWVKHVLGDVQFSEDGRARDGRKLVAWGSMDVDAVPERQIMRMEDGFLRSVGLGAELMPALSFCLDDLGIYYDPSKASRLEQLIAASTQLSELELKRAAALRAKILSAGLSKYNTGAPLSLERDKRRTILVAGQVEDDASIVKGAVSFKTNLSLLEAARARNPDARLLYKPHPDVEAGLRVGKIPDADLDRLCDAILRDISAADAIAVCDEVWCITSLIGFEALLRDKPVTCLGRPFYAGWGLTTDVEGSIERRETKVTRDQLTHAALIGYPYYIDPVTGLACPVEVAVDRLIEGSTPRSKANILLSKAQGLFATYASWWR